MSGDGLPARRHQKRCSHPAKHPLVSDSDFGHRLDEFFRHFRFRKACRAQDGAAIPRDEWHRGLLAAFGADNGVHHPWRLQAEAGLSRRAALRAAGRFIDQPFLRIECLLSGCPCEWFPAITARERPICEFHDRNPPASPQIPEPDDTGTPRLSQRNSERHRLYRWTKQAVLQGALPPRSSNHVAVPKYTK